MSLSGELNNDPQVPYENYRKVFRTSQKNIERELGGVQSASNELVACASTGALSPEDAIKSIDNMIGKVENLKRKASGMLSSEFRWKSYAPHSYQICTKQRESPHRMSCVNACTIWPLSNLYRIQTSPNSQGGPIRALIGGLWTGVSELGRKIRQEALLKRKVSRCEAISSWLTFSLHCIQTLVDIELFSDISRIENALVRHSCTEALAWCSENKTALRKIKACYHRILFCLFPIDFIFGVGSQSTLEFDLRMQEYIELSRARKTMEAIAYSKKFLISWQDTHLAQIRQLSALLAFEPNTTCGPYKVCGACYQPFVAHLSPAFV